MRRPARGLRALCVLAIFSGGLLLGPPAGAEPQISFVSCAEPTPSPSPTPPPTTSPPPDSCTPAQGSVVRGDVPIVFEIDTEFGEDLTKVTLSVVSDRDPEVPDAANPVRIWEGSELEVESERFEYAWDSTRIPGHNGRFKIVVAAASEGFDSGSSRAEWLDLRVDNPPATPAKPTVTGVTAEAVQVEWAPAREPDILHYTLYRARTESADQEPDASAFKEVRVTEKTSVSDEVSEPGAYWYKLEVTRRSIVTPDEGITSERSDRSDEAGVYVPPTPTPSPTEPPDGGGGAGSGGGGPSGTFDTTSRPRLTPRPLSRSARSGPPPPADAPFSDTLPYDLPQDGSGSGGADLAQGAEGDGEAGDQGPLPAVAIGTFLVSAALALGRLPTT